MLFESRKYYSNCYTDCLIRLVNLLIIFILIILATFYGFVLQSPPSDFNKTIIVYDALNSFYLNLVTLLLVLTYLQHLIYHTSVIYLVSILRLPTKIHQINSAKYISKIGLMNIGFSSFSPII